MRKRPAALTYKEQTLAASAWPFRVWEFLRETFNRPSTHLEGVLSQFEEVALEGGASSVPCAGPPPSGDLLIVITTCNRPAQLGALLGQLRESLDQAGRRKDASLVVLEDSAEADYAAVRSQTNCDFPGSVIWARSFERMGKRRYFMTYQLGLAYAERSRASEILFLQDDLDLEDDLVTSASRLLKALQADTPPRARPIVLNLYASDDDEPGGRWIDFPRMPHSSLPVRQTQWFDLNGYLLTREALKLLRFRLIPIDASRWRDDPNLSSGVGRQMTRRLSSRADIYQCYPPLIFHGREPSVMNPEARALRSLDNHSLRREARTQSDSLHASLEVERDGSPMSDETSKLTGQRAPDSLLRSGSFTGAAQVVRSLVELSGTLILARLLAPAAFGLVAMVTSFVMFARMFQDAGLSTATVQSKTINDRQVSTLFWINFGASLGICALFAALAPVLAWFFDDSRLVAIALLAAIGFPIQGATAQHLALLKRNLLFGRLAVVEVTSTVCATGGAIIAAWQGWDYWSLVAKLLIDRSVTLIGAAALAGFRPQLLFDWKETAPLVHFGKYITGFNLVNYLARNLDDILVGKAWGSEALGLYRRAYQLLLVPLTNVNAPMGNLAIPALSRQNGDDDAYRRTFLSLLRTLLALTLPLGGYLTAVSEPLVLFALGEQWRDAADIFLALSLLLITQPMGNATGWLFISQGRSKEMLHWSLVGASISLASFAAGLPFGAVGVAWAYSLTGAFLRLPLVLWWVSRSGPVGLRLLVTTYLPFLVLALAAYLAASGSLALVSEQAKPVQVVVPLFAAATATVLLMLSSPTGRKQLNALLVRWRGSKIP